ncbi:MAG: hypothetical protein ABGZ24_17685 [Fuerstiella sp.]
MATLDDWQCINEIDLVQKGPARIENAPEKTTGRLAVQQKRSPQNVQTQLPSPELPARIAMFS